MVSEQVYEATVANVCSAHGFVQRNGGIVVAGGTIPIRLSYLLCPDLTASVKLVWLGLRVDQNLKKSVLRSPTRIQRRIGISRPTIRKALDRLKERPRPQVSPDLHGLSQTQVRVNPALITDTAVPALARVLYCLLRGLARHKRADILSSYARIATVVHLQARTVRLAIRALVDAGWLAISQANQRAPLHFSFPDPKVARQRADLRRAKQRLEKSKYYGEALSLLWCDTLVDSTDYQDDYFPDSFTNPLTNQLLQADRYYFDYKVAVEFNGPQHDGPTLHFPAEVAQAQIARDQMKREISERQQITLITLQPKDLTFQRMRKVLGKVLPLRYVTGDEPIINYLQEKSSDYHEFIEKIRRQANEAVQASPATNV